MSVKYSSYSMKKRLLALTMLVAFFAVLVSFRVFYLQVIDSDNVVKKGLTQWLRDLPLTALRGDITDRNGVVLASSHTTYDVYIRPADVDDFWVISNIIADAVGLDVNEVYNKINGKKYSEIRVVQNIEKEAVQKILNNYQNGIFFTSNTQRDYRYNEMLCQILGFVGADNCGQTGLEKFYDSYLAGFDGVSLVESDLKGSSIDSSIVYYENAIDGLNITLSIDFRMQEAVERILAQTMIETGAKSVSCMVTNPSTGEILSICSLPSYNLNEIPRDDMGKLNELSRAVTITDTFEPGSTFKPIVTAMAIEEDLITKHNYFYCNGFRIINGVRIRCSRRTGHGSQSLEQGLMNSCNCVFMDIVAKLGLDKFYEYLDKFGLSSKLGIDFPGEVSAVLMPKSMVTAPDLARMGFGQTIALSALEMVSGIGTVINNGYVLEPHFIKSVTVNNGNVVYERGVTVKNKILSDSTSDVMRRMMFSVVDKGGGKYAKVDGYPIIGGKTGTAQKYENGKIAEGKYIGSFIGFAPYDNPEYLVYVIVDEPVGAYYGGIVAAPVAGNVFKEIFKIKNIGVTEKEDNKKTLKMPSLIGKTITEASSILSGLKLQYLIDGDGDYVLSQIPAPNSEICEGDVVLLVFE